MAAIGHSATEITTELTHTGDTAWTDISGATIADTEFTDGDRYLIFITARSGLSGFASRHQVRLLHGSTEFPQTRHIRSMQAGGTKYPVVYALVWTAVAGEGIKLQHATTESTFTVETDNIRMDVFNLDDMTENTDWWFNEDSTNTTLSTSWSTANNAAVTFTPAEADDYLVIVTQHVDMNGATGGPSNLQTRINRSGEATDVAKEGFHRQRQNIEENCIVVPWVFSLTALSNTFTADAKINGTPSAGSVLRTYSSVLVLRKGAFVDFAFAQGTGPTVLSTTAWGTEVESLGITPTATGDVFILASGFFAHDNDGDHTEQWRLRVDAGDQPPTQTADAYLTRYFGLNPDGREQILISTVENLDNTLHTLEFDASASAGTADIYSFQIVAFSLELSTAAAAAGSSPYYHLRRTRITGY